MIEICINLPELFIIGLELIGIGLGMFLIFLLASAYN